MLNFFGLIVASL